MQYFIVIPNYDTDFFKANLWKKVANHLRIAWASRATVKLKKLF